VTQVELSIPFHKAWRAAENLWGNKAYYLHNRVGTSTWSVRHIHGRVFLQVSDPRMATFFLLKL
jgi:hypothetical protein